ncbi:MAG: hypothetical protein ACPG6V_13565 [Flavobacteriales bacterium]
MKKIIILFVLISSLGFAQSDQLTKGKVTIEKEFFIDSISIEGDVPLSISCGFEWNPIVFEFSGVSAEFSSRKKQNDNLYRLYDRQYKDEKPVVISQEIKANFVTWYNELNYLEQFEYFIQDDVEWMIRR